MIFGADGFLGTRASLMLDVVALAMLLVVPALAFSVYLVMVRHEYTWHKRLQLALGLALLVTVLAFEADMRIGGWRHRAESSAFAGGDGATDWVSVVLGVHLCFAVTAALLWIVVIGRALRSFPSPAMPSPHSPWHRRFGMAAAIDMVCTAVTGWIFYYVAFVA
jgi:uncharacterized membrane protein YozB (DUF420 family)